MICPRGGIVLDMFAGSGSTGVAALAEGCRFLGIEREPDFAEIASARLTHAAAQLSRQPSALATSPALAA